MTAVLLFGGEFGLGVCSALIFARSARLTAELVGIGLVLAVVVFAVAWAFAPSRPAPGDTCQDCGYWLGRYWELGFVVFVLLFSVIAWTAGVLAGSAARRRRERRTAVGWL